MTDDVFCVLPYNSLSLDGPGRPRLCCNNHGHWEDYSQPFINDCNEPLDVLNSKLHKSVRLAIANGQRHPSCSKCWKIEDSGGTSFRQIWNDVYKNHTPSAITNDGTLLPGAKIEYLDITFGNKCNLVCRMCNWMNSHLWMHDLIKLDRWKTIDADRRSIRQIWFEDPHAVDIIKQSLTHVTHMNFLGGEPLIVKQHMDILQACIDLGLAANQQISYNTNLTNLPQELLNMWQAFGHVNINVSIEAIGTANDYIRQNSDWRIIYDNIQRISNLSSQNIKLELHTTFGIYNCYNVAELIAWTTTQSCFTSLPFVNIIYHPTYQDVRLLPVVAKNEIRAEVSAALSAALVGFENDRNYSSWIGALNYMDTDPSDAAEYEFDNWPADAWHQFWYDTDQLDKLKHRAIEDYLPRLAKLRP